MVAEFLVSVSAGCCTQVVAQLDAPRFWDLVVFDETAWLGKWRAERGAFVSVVRVLTDYPSC